MKLFNKVAAIAVGVVLATGVGAGIVIGSKNAAKVDAATAAGTFMIDFYDSSKLSSTSGTNFTNNNYSGFVDVPTGISATDVVTSVSVTGTVQYGKNGGLTAGTSTAAGANSHYVTFNIGSGYAVNKCTVYATAYESGRWLLNGNAADSGSLGSKGAEIANVTDPLIWDNLDGITALTFKKDNGSGGNQKRLTLYRIVCEYGSSGPAKTETSTSVSAQNNKTTLDVTASPADTVQLTATVTYNSGANTISNPDITWSSDNTSVATVSSTGLVTAVSKGVAEITASYAGDNTYAGSSGKKTITVANPNEVVFESAHDQGISSGQNEDTITVSDISMHCTSMHDTDAAGYRFYQNSTLTFTRTTGKIASIAFTGVSSYPINRLSVAPGSTGTLTTNGNNGTWEGAANAVSFVATAQARASKIVITYYTGADVDLDKSTLLLTAGGFSSTVSVETVDGVTSPSYLWSVSDGDDCVTLSNTTSATVTVAPKAKFASCTLSVTVNGTNLSEAITRDVTVTVVRASSSGSPFDINEAKRAVDYNDATYTGEAYVAGIVSEVDSYDSTHKSITYWISDDGTTANQFEVYSGKGLSGADFEALSDVLVGAEVVVKGSIKKYNSDYEFNYNNELVSYTAPDYETYMVTYVATDVDSGTVPVDHNSYRDNAEVTVLGNTGNLEKDGYSFTGWNDGTTTYLAGDTFNIHDNVTLTAVWGEVIDSDITMTPGDHGSNASVVTTNSETKPAVKCGTGSAAGSMTLTLKNSGISKIKVYVAGWNNDTGKNIDVDIDNGTISPTSIAVTADSGISGSGSTYTLNASESTYAFEFALTNAPADAVITLTAHTDSKNRFVVWGATDLLADTFSSDFLTKLVCDSEGTIQPTYTNSYSWSKFNSIYNSMDYDEKAKLHDATANQSGTDIQKAMARYDYIVGKYLKGQGIAAYNDFIGRNPAKIGASRTLNMFNEETGTAAAMVVVVVSAVSVTAIGGFFLLKKKPF